MKPFTQTADEFIQNLRLLYLHHIAWCESVAALAQYAGIPFETLRRFSKSEGGLLCPANEEKLARALGHDASFFRRVVARFHRFQEWQRRRKQSLNG